jgi:hypothetical protein
MEFRETDTGVGFDYKCQKDQNTNRFSQYRKITSQMSLKHKRFESF